MNTAWLSRVLFPVTVLAFAAIGVKYFSILFTVTTRWMFLALLASLLLLQGRIFAGLKSGFSFTLLLYFAWCVGTVLWSDVPQLSLLKSIALILTVVTILSAGHSWVVRLRPDQSFSFLIPIAFLALFAGFGGASGVQAINTSLSVVQGLTGNPNYLGMLVAIGFPYAAFLAYRAFHHRKPLGTRMLAAGLVAALGFTLWQSGSRASMLCVLMTGFFAVASLTASKKLIFVASLVAAVAGTMVILPQIQDKFYHRLIVKGNKSGDVLFSRTQPWAESYGAALQGGYFGVGYGVSVGDTDFDVGLTANTYGREKGNTQLAVWEETGLVGLGLYSLLLIGIFKRIHYAFRLAPPGSDLRVALAIGGGMIVGMTLESAFEAWWVAPGSMEFAAFWAFVGVTSGLAERAIAARRRPRFAFQPARGLEPALLHRMESERSSRAR